MAAQPLEVWTPPFGNLNDEIKQINDETKRIASEPRCENCRFAEANMRGKLHCHRFPPRIDNDGHQLNIPFVDEDFWCGEFQPKDKP